MVSEVVCFLFEVTWAFGKMCDYKSLIMSSCTFHSDVLQIPVYKRKSKKLNCALESLKATDSKSHSAINILWEQKD